MNRNALKYALIASVGLRLLTGGLLMLAVFFLPVRGQPEFFHSPQTLQELENGGILSRLFLSPWYRWDTAHYLELAENGYSLEAPERAVWPPIYPLLIRALSAVVSSPLLAALLISSLALLAAFYLLYLLVADIWDEKLARETLLWMAVFPTGFFLVAAYSEALFLAFALLSLWAARKRRGGLAGLAGALAACTRNLGVLLALPLLWEVCIQFRENPAARWRPLLLALAGVSLIPLAPAVFFVYQHVVQGFPWPWNSLSAGWQQRWAWPWEGLLGNLRLIFTLKPSLLHFSFIFDLISAVGGVYLLLRRKAALPVSLALYAWAFFLPPLMKINSWNATTGVSRYILTAFPIFILLAQNLDTRQKKMAWLFFSVISQELLLLLFYKWIWVA